VGSGVVRFERALVSSYRSSIPLRVSEIIAAFVLQHATFSHPTSSLPKISPCSPGPCEWADDLWARKSEGIRLIVSAVSFQYFQPMCS